MPKQRNTTFQGLRLKKNSKNVRMPLCQYGSGCRRKGCIYRHPEKTRSLSSEIQKDPRTCKFFLMGQCTFGNGCRYTHPKDAQPKPQEPIQQQNYGNEPDPRVATILRKASLSEFEKQRQIRELQRTGKVTTTTTTTSSSKMSASSASWTPSFGNQTTKVISTPAPVIKDDDVLVSAPKVVEAVLPESLVRRVCFVTNAICNNTQILNSEDDMLSLDDVISILLPLEEVSSFLRDQQPVNGRKITYMTVLWCVRQCLRSAVTKLRGEKKIGEKEEVNDELKLLERSLRFASPIPDEAPTLPMSESDSGSFMSMESSYGMASHLQLISLQQSFPHVPRSVVASMFESKRGDMSETIKMLVNSFGAPLKKKDEEEEEEKKKESNTSSSFSSSSSSSKPVTTKRVVSLNLTWVDAGSSVSSAYTKDGLRKQATEHAKLRNKFFQQATEAYLRGDGALAKTISQKGRSHDVEMKRLHAIASERIHRERQSYTGNDATVLDLHGQHISEAITRAEGFLEYHRRSGATREVTLITGAGKHSIIAPGRSLGRRTLREALRGWLQRTQGRGRFYELKGDAAGSFVVSV